VPTTCTSGSTEDIATRVVRRAWAPPRWVEAPFRFEMIEDVSHWVPEEAALSC